MKKKIVCLICSFLMVTLLSACVSTHHKTMKNAALDDPGFLQNLKKQGCVSIIAPASGVSFQAMNRIKKLNSLNLKFYNSTNESSSPYHSYEDPIRVKELDKALHDKCSRVIWALRGGYGSGRLIPHLLTRTKPDKQKILIGYSDITALHLLFNRWGLKSIHGPMVSELLTRNKDPQNFKLLGDILSKKFNTMTYSGLVPLNLAARLALQTKGCLLGGNLTVISSSVGTSWEINAKNKIITLEDIGEGGYAIDRNLTHLKQAHIFDNAKAVIFGEFTQSDHFAAYAIQRFAYTEKIPVYKVYFFGHGYKNYPLIFGTPCKIYKTPNQEFNLLINL